MKKPLEKNKKVEILQKEVNDLQTEVHSLKALLAKIDYSKSNSQDEKALKEMDKKLSDY